MNPCNYSTVTYQERRQPAFSGKRKDFSKAVLLKALKLSESEGRYGRPNGVWPFLTVRYLQQKAEMIMDHHQTETRV